MAAHYSIAKDGAYGAEKVKRHDLDCLSIKKRRIEALRQKPNSITSCCSKTTTLQKCHLLMCKSEFGIGKKTISGISGFRICPDNFKKTLLVLKEVIK